MDPGHPLAVFAGVIIGAAIVWRWRRRPLEFDVTIRNKHPEGETDAG